MTKIVELKPARSDDWKAGAEYLRELADRFERGEVNELVVVTNDKEGNCFASWGHFEDRWRLLGALEYAKNTVHRN